MGKRVLVTGGNRGIGLAIARRFRAAGHTVFTPTRQEMDLASSSSITAWLDGNGVEWDVLVNNAAENRICPLVEIPLADWRKVLEVNLSAPFLLIQRVAPHMRARGWGRIVNVSSCYSLVTRAGRAPYSASKSGLNSLTRSAALENAREGILVNAVLPGFVETDMTHRNNPQEAIAALQAQIPLGRLAVPEEIAELAYWLGSDANTYVTGQTFIIDGGFICQ